MLRARTEGRKKNNQKLRWKYGPFLQLRCVCVKKRPVLEHERVLSCCGLLYLIRMPTPLRKVFWARWGQYCNHHTIHQFIRNTLWTIVIHLIAFSLKFIYVSWPPRRDLFWEGRGGLLFIQKWLDFQVSCFRKPRLGGQDKEEGSTISSGRRVQIQTMAILRRRSFSRNSLSILEVFERTTKDSAGTMTLCLAEALTWLWKCALLWRRGLRRTSFCLLSCYVK